MKLNPEVKGNTAQGRSPVSSMGPEKGKQKQNPVKKPDKADNKGISSPFAGLKDIIK